MLAEILLPFVIHIPFLNIDIRGISTYALFMVLAFFTGSYFARREMIKRELQLHLFDTILLLAVIGTLIGAKLGYLLEIWSSVWFGRESFFEKFSLVFFTFKGMGERYPGMGVGLWESLFAGGGGLVFYGGLLFSILLLWIFFRFKKINSWSYADALMPALAAGYAVGRTGCMVSGDGCFGYAAPFKIPLLTSSFGPNSIVNTGGVTVWNTPLIEAVASLMFLFFYFGYLQHKSFRTGFIFALFLIWNAGVRFFVEFLRLNDAVVSILPPPVIVHPSGATIPLTYRNAVASGMGAGYYFKHWHWYGFTLSQLFAVGWIVVALIWVKSEKLYKNSND